MTIPHTSKLIAADYYGLFIAALMIFPCAYTYVALLIWTIPFLAWIHFYAGWIRKPARCLHTDAWTKLAWWVCLIVGIPWIVMAIVSLAFIMLATHLLALPFALVYKIPVRANWALVKPLCCQAWDISYTSLFTATVGTEFRQGFLKFWLTYPQLVTIVPVLKYSFVCNIFLHELSTVKTNQWTAIIPKSAEQTRDDLINDISYSLHTLSTKGGDVLRAHYPFQHNLGMQYSNNDFLVLFAHAVLQEPSATTKSGTSLIPIYKVHMSYWLPHILTGLAEVNIQMPHSTDPLISSRIEVPIWTVMGKNALASRLFNRITWLLAVDGTEF
jgi:hypothetical protein